MTLRHSESDYKKKKKNLPVQSGQTLKSLKSWKHGWNHVITTYSEQDGNGGKNKRTAAKKTS